MAIREGTGFTRKRRKKRETEGKKLMARVNQQPVSGWEPREWTPQSLWPRRESAAQEQGQRPKAKGPPQREERYTCIEHLCAS